MNMKDRYLLTVKVKTYKLSLNKYRYSVDEIIWSQGLIVYKKDSKKVVYIETPINFNSKAKYHVIYESQEEIRKLQPTIDYDEKPRFYIVDEAKILKLGSLESKRGRKRIEIIKEYYVSREFTGDTDFIVKEDMIYQGLDGVLLQDRDSKRNNSATKFSLNECDKPL